MSKYPAVVVCGNNKGGVGKSTLAFHLAIGFLYQGFRVSCIDLDGGQGTLSRSIENRQKYSQSSGQNLDVPSFLRVSPEESPLEELKEKISQYIASCGADVVIIDCPGTDNALARYGHALADVLVSPMNDSSIDLDLFVNISQDGQSEVHVQKLPLGPYAHMVWEQRLERAAKQSVGLEWVVVRNRMHNLVSRNQLYIENILTRLSKRIGFHVVGTIGERVIFRELFPLGLTLLDKQEKNTTLSHITARQELRTLSDFLLKLLKLNA